MRRCCRNGAAVELVVQQVGPVRGGRMETLPELQEDVEFSSDASPHMLLIPYNNSDHKYYSAAKGI
jgi:hypothetical protein